MNSRRFIVTPAHHEDIVATWAGTEEGVGVKSANVTCWILIDQI
jgi:hypothetical protein